MVRNTDRNSVTYPQKWTMNPDRTALSLPFPKVTRPAFVVRTLPDFTRNALRFNPLNVGFTDTPAVVTLEMWQPAN